MLETNTESIDRENSEHKIDREYRTRRLINTLYPAIPRSKIPKRDKFNLLMVAKEYRFLSLVSGRSIDDILEKSNKIKLHEIRNFVGKGAYVILSL